MIELLNPIWWLTSLGQSWRWLAVCLVATAAAVPLCLRLFRGLPDRGAALAPVLGISLVAMVAWLAALPLGWGGASGIVPRAAVLACVGIGTWLGWMTSRDGLRRRRVGFAVIGVMLALVPVPHTMASGWGGVLLLGAASGVAWLGERERLVALVRLTAPSLIVGTLLFVLGFLFFANVRSYLPWATFDISLYAAEKLGNLMHLNSMMRARWMPPGDAWFMGEPTNYYYGGHLMMATLAKMSATPVEVAFNLGVATTFASIVSGGFGFVLGLVNGTGGRRWWSVAGRRVLVVRGLGWGVLGGLAIGTFGNVEAWQQLFTRDPEYVRTDVELRLRDAAGAGGEAVVPSHEDLFLTPEHLLRIDFWRPSRTIKGTPPYSANAGTITEFPYFSAILGDLHPHHMAMPHTLLALAFGLQLVRRTARGARAEGAWWRRGVLPLAGLGVMLGAVFAVNIWDTVVLTVVTLALVVLARRGLAADPAWRWVGYAGAVALLSWGGALVANARSGEALVFGEPAYWLAGLAAAVVFPLALSLLRRSVGTLLLAALGVAVAVLPAAAGALAHARSVGAVDPISLALRDAAVLGLAVAVAAAWALRPSARCLHNWFATGAAYGVVGVLALLVSQPFRWFFQTPLSLTTPLFQDVLPPVVGEHLKAATEGFAVRVWASLPIMPLPSELRTEFTDFLTCWGLFLVPVAGLLALQATRAARRWGAGPAWALIGLAAAMVAWSWNGTGYLLPGVVLFLCVGSWVLAAGERRGRDGALLAMLGAAFFWCFFCEVLFFNDNMEGENERYNTLFKLYYPLWAIFAGGAVAALATLAHAPRGEAAPSARGLARAGLAAAVVCIFVVIGALYPLAATATRTHHFFAQSERAYRLNRDYFEGMYARGRTPDFATRRTLDALAWLEQTPEYHGDLAAIRWLRANAPAGSVVLEAPIQGSYSAEGRVSAGSGVPTILGWRHHEHQWRGWGVPLPAGLRARVADLLTPSLLPVDGALRYADPNVQVPSDASEVLYGLAESPDALRARLREMLPQADAKEVDGAAREILSNYFSAMSYMNLMERLFGAMSEIYRAPLLSEGVMRTLRRFRVRYVFVGTVERRTFPPEALAKFDAFKRVHDKDGVVIYEVPEAAQ